MKSREQIFLVLLCLATRLHAQANQDSSLSLQGFSGVLNTPNAHVQREGTVDVLYTNQRENLPLSGIPAWEDNYFFSVGMFSFAEVGARLTNIPPTGIYTKGDRDLSVNGKLSTAPLTSHFRFSPTLAVGVEDVGGASHFFDTTYVVASADPLGWLRVSAGYGTGPDRMKGAFGGVELRAHDWVTLLGDYDTRDTNVGVRLSAPPLPYIRARLTGTLSRSIENSKGLVLTGGFTMPLNFKESSRQRAASTSAHDTLWGALTAKKVRPAAPNSVSPPIATSGPVNPAIPPTVASIPAPEPSPQVNEASSQINEALLASMVSLQARLVKAGFVNVRVGLQGKTLVVEYENIRYNHSELDAIGVVAGVASQGAGNGAEELRMVVRRKGLALLQIEAPLLPLRNWLDGNESIQPPALTVSQKVTPEDRIPFVIGDTNPGRLKPSLMVYPSLITLVGTDYGLFDYQLSIRPELQLPLWAGATGVARADIPVAWTPNLDNGQVYSSYRTPARLDRLMFFQAIPLAPGLVANLGAGKILDSDKGTLNELSWTLGGGMNRFKVTQSWGRDVGTTRNVLLGSYRYFLARHDLAFEGTGGRFYGQDTGFIVSMQRFFGDSSVTLYFKDAVTPTNSNRLLQAGLQLEFPLTPRRDMKARPIQIRGNEDWSYAQETGIASSNSQNENYLAPSVAIVPEPTQSLATYYYDRERLNADYILSHTDRIREAWRFFRNQL